MKSQITLESPSPIETGDLKVAADQNAESSAPLQRISGLLNNATSETASNVEVIAKKGRVTLHATNWLSSLNLGFGPERMTDSSRTNG